MKNKGKPNNVESIISLYTLIIFSILLEIFFVREKSSVLILISLK